MRAGATALVTILALLGGAGGVEASPAFYAGGSLPEAAVTGTAYTPTVGVTLRPRADGRVTVAFNTTLRCGRALALVRGGRTVAWDGAAVQAAGRGRARLGAGRATRFAWALQAGADGQTATGELRIRARRHGETCRGRAPRGFVAPLVPAAAGAPSRPAAGTAFYGGGPRLARGRRPGPVVLRVSPDGSRVAARWSAAARCAWLANLTPPTAIGADGSFARRERFGVRYPGGRFVRFRAHFAGRFTGATATGSLRLRATVLTHRGGAVRERCDTGRRAWSARGAGEAPGTPAPVPTAPGPAGPTAPPPSSPDPTFRPDPVIESWSLAMDSDPGEYIGQGESWRHGSAYGESIDVDVFGAGNIVQAAIRARDGEEWTVSWSTRDGSSLHAGTYGTGPGGAGSQGYGGHGRGCGTFGGSFTIAAIEYGTNGALRTFDVSFTAYCENLPEALRGEFHLRTA